MEEILGHKCSKKIGNYQLGELIGKGAVGYVYKGFNQVDSSLVAIKQVAKHTIRDAELNSIQSEITLLKKLKHPNIVKYIDFISSDLH